jgi:uncharacterized repeat protein (TIGR01451 family)
LIVDPGVTKTVNNGTPVPGATIVYTITAHNFGSTTVNDVTATDSIPAGITYVSHTLTQGVYSNVTSIWNVGTLASGGDATLTITATVDGSTLGTVINTVTITGSSPSDPNSANNTASASIVVTTSGGGGGGNTGGGGGSTGGGGGGSTGGSNDGSVLGDSTGPTVTPPTGRVLGDSTLPRTGLAVTLILTLIAVSSLAFVSRGKAVKAE